jgi:cold shock CspA family protein
MLPSREIRYKNIWRTCPSWTGIPPNKGFGFIGREDGQPDLFFHISACRSGQPGVGDHVRFAVSVGHDGRPCAAEVELCAPAPGPGVAAKPGARGALPADGGQRAAARDRAKIWPAR